MKKAIFLAVITFLISGYQAIAQGNRTNVPYDKSFYGDWDNDGSTWSFKKNNTCNFTINGNSLSGRIKVAKVNANSVILEITDLGDLPGYFEFSFVFSDDRNSSDSYLRFIYSGRVGDKSNFTLRYKGNGYINSDFEKPTNSKADNEISLSPAGIKEKVKNINSLVKEYDKNKKNYFKQEIPLPDDEDLGLERSITIYSYKNEIKIIRYNHPGDDCGYYSDIYYKDNEVFYIYFNSICFVDKVSEHENRYYFEDNKLIQYLEGKKKKLVKKDTYEFKEAESWMQSLIDEVQEYKK